MKSVDITIYHMYKSYKSYTLLLTLKLNSPPNHSLAVRYTLMRGSQISYLPLNFLRVRLSHPDSSWDQPVVVSISYDTEQLNLRPHGTTG